MLGRQHIVRVMVVLRCDSALCVPTIEYVDTVLGIVRCLCFITQLVFANHRLEAKRNSLVVVKHALYCPFLLRSIVQF